MTSQNATVLPSGWSPSSVISYITLAIGVVVILSSRLLPSQSGGVHNLGGIPILAAWAFFTKRYDFLWKHFNSEKKYFQFRVLQVCDTSSLFARNQLLL